MTRVIVLQGGWSAEREVSLTSGKGICESLARQGYEVIPVDPSPDLQILAKQLADAKGDVVFNALHGTGGEDGTIQAVLDLAKIPYTHSGLNASATGMNKKMTKAIVSAIGVNIATDKVITRSALQNGHPLPLPYVVKPVADGSSVGVTIVKTDTDLQNALKNGAADQEVLVEKFITGDELTVAVSSLFSADGEPVALGVTMLKSNNDFYDYTAKYTDGVTQHIVNPDLPADVIADLKRSAVAAHKALGCRMVSRSDFRYNPTDGIVFLETNTHPGFTPLSLLPEQAQANGISFDQLTGAMIKSALNPTLQSVEKHGDNGTNQTKVA
jgi:D-alanine-D-alanine ligase